MINKADFEKIFDNQFRMLSRNTEKLMNFSGKAAIAGLQQIENINQRQQMLFRAYKEKVQSGMPNLEEFKFFLDEQLSNLTMEYNQILKNLNIS